ncbi:uncharacterized protein ACIQIH_010777 [Cyanocitta cristata]
MGQKMACGVSGYWSNSARLFGIFCSTGQVCALHVEKPSKAIPVLGNRAGETFMSGGIGLILIRCCQGCSKYPVSPCSGEATAQESGAKLGSVRRRFAVPVPAAAPVSPGVIADVRPQNSDVPAHAERDRGAGGTGAQREDAGASPAALE